MHILIIEDDETFRQELAALLRGSLYRVTAPAQLDHIAASLSSIRPDLILLDLNLPGQSGFEVCTEIRKSSDVPIIFVTGRSDDYITKPFQPAVLLAHITAVRKRTGRWKEEPVLEHRGVELDLAKGQVRFQGVSAELTKNELKILSCLFRHRGSIVSRAELTEYLWDEAVFLDDNALSIHITRIRGKLQELGLSDFIRTKRGMGYSI